ncbi:uncharacterized protein LOC134820880 [Bolinopsis microptera]|uniref:uncharacterized protein LOC134820880 n=1 Tax=Bolinopsis microptera TaxID=2820187 RepID=UPI00307A8B48
MSEEPPPYSKPLPPPIGQITYSSVSAPPLPEYEQEYTEPTQPITEKVAATVVLQQAPVQQQIVVQQAQVQPRAAASPRSACTTSLNIVMLIALLVIIPAGAVMWYLGSVRGETGLKIAGICLQGFSFVVVELLQLLWYLHEKNAFLHANLTLVRQ